MNWYVYNKVWLFHWVILCCYFQKLSIGLSSWLRHCGLTEVEAEHKITSNYSLTVYKTLTLKGRNFVLRFIVFFLFCLLINFYLSITTWQKWLSNALCNHWLRCAYFDFVLHCNLSEKRYTCTLCFMFIVGKYDCLLSIDGRY